MLPVAAKGRHHDGKAGCPQRETGREDGGGNQQALKVYCRAGRKDKSSEKKAARGHTAGRTSASMTRRSSSQSVLAWSAVSRSSALRFAHCSTLPPANMTRAMVVALRLQLSDCAESVKLQSQILSLERERESCGVTDGRNQDRRSTRWVATMAAWCSTYCSHAATSFGCVRVCSASCFVRSKAVSTPSRTLPFTLARGPVMASTSGSGTVVRRSPALHPVCPLAEFLGCLCVMAERGKGALVTVQQCSRSQLASAFLARSARKVAVSQRWFQCPALGCIL